MNFTPASPIWEQTLKPQRPTPSDPAWYALRRTLPPWRFDENLLELSEYLVSFRVNEIIVKIDTEEFWHGQPKVEDATATLSRLFQIKSLAESLGIKYSLNPWVTLGHADRGRDDRRRHFGFQGLVGHDGVECLACACPLSEFWRENTAAVWRLYAETKPHVMWIEDDIRTFNHEPVKFSCFCPLHLARFSQSIGEEVSRTALVQAMLRSGNPHPWREQYLGLQSEISIEACRILTKAVRSVSPQTSMGLMSSGPRLHCLEGRDWRGIARALSDGGSIHSRPPLANYCEGNLRGLYYAQDAIKATRHNLPAETTEHTEIENLPFSRFSKSVSFTFLQIALSFAYGSHGVSLNLFDHCGTPMADEPWYGEMLGREKANFQAIASRAQGEGVLRGVRLLHHEKAGCRKRLLNESGYDALEGDGYEMMEALESCGIPTTYSSSAVVAVNGQTLRAFPDCQIIDLLRGGMLLDGPAASVLYERGFGKEIGVETMEGSTNLDAYGVFSAEEFHSEKFGGAEHTFLTISPFGHRPGYLYFQVSLVADAEIISSLTDADAVRVKPLFYAFENHLGGRVIVYLMDLKSIYGPGFLHSHRQSQFHAMVKWLAHGEFPALCRATYPLVLRKDCANTSFLGLFNLTLDLLHDPVIECSDPRAIKKIERLVEGQWITDSAVEFLESGSSKTIVARGELDFRLPLFLTIFWEESVPA